MIDIPEQISTAWIAAASVAFLIKHFLADFLLQTDWMAAGKDRPKGWLLPLAAHAGVHVANLIEEVAGDGIPDLAIPGLVEIAGQVFGKEGGRAGALGHRPPELVAL